MAEHTEHTEHTGQKMDRKYQFLIVLLSVAVPLLVGYLIYRPQMLNAQGKWVLMLPHINAAINGTTSLLLLAGLYFIRHKNVVYHRKVMISAFVLGALFLISYVVYHSTTPSTSYGGEGWVRSLYYFFLLSHILLAAVVVPLVLMALYYALKDKISQHKRIVKFAYPIWLYVSLTGVIVYLMISPYYAF